MVISGPSQAYHGLKLTVSNVVGGSHLMMIFVRTTLTNLADCNLSCLPHYVLMLLLCVPAASSTDAPYFCKANERTLIERVESGIIKTVYTDQSTYENDMKCEWVIDAGERGYIALDVTDSDLVWAPPGAICSGYDNIEVHNGSGPSDVEVRPGEDTENLNVIVSWCGERNPYHIHSRGRYIYIVFVSDDRQAGRRGVTLSFTRFATEQTLGGCPPSWSDNPRLPDGGPACFWVSSHQQPWITSQLFCGYQQANLASLDSEEEANFVTDLVANNTQIGSYDNVWIGLNDIEKDATYRWINGSENKEVFRWRKLPHHSDDYLNCVNMQYSDGKWEEDFCNENSIKTVARYNFICKLNKVGARTVYKVPSNRIDKEGEEGVDAPVRLIAIVVAVGVVLIIAGIAGVYLYRRYKHRRPPAAPPSYNVAVGLQAVSNRKNVI